MDSILDINDILNEYSEDIQVAITESAEKVAKEGADRLKTSSPKRTGKYAKGWRVKTTKGQGFINCVVYNATNYQLTHLLEKSHLTRNGGKTKPQVHIAPVEEYCNNKYEKEVETIIENGG